MSKNSKDYGELPDYSEQNRAINCRWPKDFIEFVLRVVDDPSDKVNKPLISMQDWREDQI